MASLGQRENPGPLVLSFGGRKIRGKDTCQLESDLLLASENSWSLLARWHAITYVETLL